MSDSVSVRDLIGKRCLLNVKSGYSRDTNEHRVLEMSPSGNWVKLQNLYGHKFWLPTVDLSLVEVLRDIRAEKMADKPE